MNTYIGPPREDLKEELSINFAVNMAVCMPLDSEPYFGG
jgi:hypothetical protein